MSWIKRHNEKVFRKKIRQRLEEKLSDSDFTCRVNETYSDWGIFQNLEVNFYYERAQLTIRFTSIDAYFDYDNETVDSASDKIIDGIKQYCHKFNSDKASWGSECFSVDFLSSYILEKFGGEE